MIRIPAAIVASVALFLWAGLALAQARRPLPTGAPASADLVTSERDDISVFTREFLNVDRSFSSAARAEADQRLSRIEHAPKPMSPVDFAVELCRIAALADNGHTECLAPQVARAMCGEAAAAGIGVPHQCNTEKTPSFNSVPLLFGAFGTTFNVVAAPPADSDLVGARLIGVDHEPIQRILPVLRTLQGGIEAWRDIHVADVLSSPDQMHAVGVSRESDSVTYRLVTLKGRTVERAFRVEPSAVRGGALVTVLSAGHTPWALQHLELPYRWSDAPQLDAVVVQIRQIEDTADDKIVDFLRQAEMTRERLRRDNVILDMRSCGGGDLLLTRDFMASWPTKLPESGRIFVLVGPRTFSAGIATVAYLKQAGKSKVVLVGAHVGDRLEFFAEGLPIQLPHSGLMFLPATARHDYRDGCRHYDDCFAGIAQPGHKTGSPPWLAAAVSRKPISVASLAPDIVAPWTVESLLKGDDPAIDAVSHAIAKH